MSIGLALCYFDPTSDTPRPGDCLIWPIGPIYPLPGHGGMSTTTTTSTTTNPDTGDGNGGKNSGKPIDRESEHILSDLSVVGSIIHASSSIVDDETRAEMTEAIKRTVKRMDVKARKYGFSLHTTS